MSLHLLIWVKSVPFRIYSRSTVCNLFPWQVLNLINKQAYNVSSHLGRTSSVERQCIETTRPICQHTMLFTGPVLYAVTQNLPFWPWQWPWWPMPVLSTLIRGGMARLSSLRGWWYSKYYNAVPISALTRLDVEWYIPVGHWLSID